MTIAKALAPFATFWHEDPIKMDSLANLARYAAASPAPICASETLGSIFAFRDLLETGAAGVIMFDIGWCGGISEARKIAAMAEAWRLSVAPHDCTGPVVFALRPIFRSTRRTRSSRKACAPITGLGIATLSPGYPK